MAIEQKDKVGNLQLLLFIGCLLFPLTLQCLFHPGDTAEYRVVVMMLEFLVVAVGGFFYQSPVKIVSANYAILVAFWLIWGGICTFYAKSLHYGLLRQMEWMIILMFFATLVRAILEERVLIKWIYGMLLAGFAIACEEIIALWYDLAHPQLYSWLMGLPHFNHIRHFGYYAAAASVLSLIPLFRLSGMSVKKRASLSTIVLYIFHILALALLLWSGSRGAVLALVAGVVVLGLFATNMWIRLRFYLLFTLGATLGLYISTFYQVKQRGLGFLSAVDRTVGSESLNAVSSGRLSIWDKVLTTILHRENGLLFGIGPDSFRLYPDMSSGGAFSQPHSMFVQFLAEWGVVGCGLFLLLLATLFFIGIKTVFRITRDLHEADDEIVLASFGAVVSLTVLGLVDGTYFHALPLTVLSTCFAIVYSRNRMDPL